jgi:glutamyl-tRNA reductase
MKLFVAGLSYKTAPVELREQLAVSPAKLRCVGCRLKVGGGLAETVVLSTCNRVEIYGLAEHVNGNIPPLFNQLAARPVDVAAHLYVHEGEAAASHLFSVAGGMDSMVLGETEITGQVKQAYQAAQAAGLTGRVLNRLFQKALQTGTEIRTQTQVGRGATSVGSVAVELAGKIFSGGLADQSVMIIGAGKMGEACLRHLAKRGAKSVLVANRSFDRAESLAAEIGGQAVRFEDRLEALAGADIVVSSTGCPELILHRAEVASVMARRAGRPLVLIDIAVPRDLDPEIATLPNVYLYDIDDLETIVRENTKQREQELTACRRIIATHAAEVMARLETPAAHRAPAPEPVSEPAPGWILSGAAA